MLVIQRRFQNVTIIETEICFCLENAMGSGGGNIPIVVIRNDNRISPMPRIKGNGNRMARRNSPNS